MAFLKTVIDQILGHTHVVYTRDDGTGITSIDNNHSHEIVVDMNEFGEQAVPIMTEVQGHAHELMEMPIKAEKKKEDDAVIVNDVLALRKYAEEWEFTSREKSKSAEKFYSGDGQWDSEVKAELTGSGRAAVTVNKVEGKIDILSGIQRNNRTDIKFSPVDGSDARLADIANILVKNVTTLSDFRYEETDAFETAAIGGRGSLELRIDRSKNIHGDIIIEEFPEGNIFYGEHIKKDARDMEYYCKEKWFSWYKLKNMHPKKVENLEREIKLYEGSSEKFIKGEGYTNAEKGTSTTAGGVQVSSYVNKAKKEFKVVECLRKHFTIIPILVNRDEDVVFNAANFKDEDVKAVKSIPGFNVIERENVKIRRTKVTSGTLLSDDFDDEFDDLPLFPIYAKKRGQKFWGKISPVMDLQREIDKEHSQVIDILNHVAGYGWFIYPDTFAPGEEQRFRATSSKAGFITKVANKNAKPEKVEGVKFPSEIVQIIALNNAEMRETMNINVELAGLSGGANQSGIAIKEKKKQQLIGNEFLFDNQSRSKVRLGKAILHAIKKLYTTDRILKILHATNTQAPIDIGGHPFMNPEENLDRTQEIQQLLDEEDITRLHVTVGESAFSTTNRESNFAIWMDLASRGAVPVPVDMLIDMSDLPDKAKWIQRIMQDIQAKAQAEQEKNQVEITKTQIAAQAKLQGGVQGTKAVKS